MPIKAQKLGWPGMARPSSQPSAPPTIRRGATTPPEVPDDSETSQMPDFTSSTDTTTAAVNLSWRRSSMMS